ncbi:MAG: DUF420 domain-containing protein [Phycisphaeraceae bacterium]
MDLSFLPAVNAGLNALAATLLVTGLVLIRKRRITAHRNAMIAAFAVSCVFLVTYVLHYVWRASVEGGAHTRLNVNGALLVAYYVMLVSHVLLAMTVPFFAVALIWLGLRRCDALHRRIARVGWPIWLYVSVTGVAIYFILYHLNPTAD